MSEEELPETEEERQARPPKPVPEELPEEGDDPDQFEEEPIAEEDFQIVPGVGLGEAVEPREPPNNLSDIDKEFED